MQSVGINALLHYPDGKLCTTADCPYGVPGDLLWVTEAWRVETDSRHATSIDVIYRANGEHGKRHNRDGGEDDPDRIIRAQQIEQRCLPHYSPRWQTPRHMPRWAARLWLRVVEVRVQRVQEISKDDAMAEGLEVAEASKPPRYGVPGISAMLKTYGAMGNLGQVTSDPCWAFRTLWNSFNAKRGHPWSNNDWVWAITFEQAEKRA